MKTIFFYGHKNQYGWLSNFYPTKIYFLGYWWKTSEHIYQAMKTLSKDEKELIRKAKGPGEAKKLGQKITLKENWDKIKYGTMKIILMQKFSQNTILMRKLLETGDAELIENSPTDYIWGCGKDFSGKNLLGKALMEVREYLKEGK